MIEVKRDSELFDLLIDEEFEETPTDKIIESINEILGYYEKTESRNPYPPCDLYELRNALKTIEKGKPYLLKFYEAGHLYKIPKVIKILCEEN